MAKKSGKRKVSPGDVASNRQASYRFEFLDKLETGMVLQGTEVKALRDGGAQLKDGYLLIRDGRAKAEIALARGKDQFDKREVIKERESKRDMQRALREANR